MKKTIYLIISLIFLSACNNIKEYDNRNNSSIYDGQQEIKNSEIIINNSSFD